MSTKQINDINVDDLIEISLEDLADKPSTSFSHERRVNTAIKFVIDNYLVANIGKHLEHEIVLKGGDTDRGNVEESPHVESIVDGFHDVSFHFGELEY